MKESDMVMQDFLHNHITLEWVTKHSGFTPTVLSSTYRLTEAERGTLVARLKEGAGRTQACKDSGVDPSYARYVLARDEAINYPRSQDLTGLFRKILRATIHDDKPPKVTIGFSPAIQWAQSLEVHLEDTHTCVGFASHIRSLLNSSDAFWCAVLLDRGWTHERIALAGFSPTTGRTFTKQQKILLKEHSFLEDKEKRAEAWEVLVSCVEVMQSSTAASAKGYAESWLSDIFSLFYGGAFSDENVSRKESNKIHQRNSRLRVRILAVLEGAEAFLSGGGADLDRGRMLCEKYPTINKVDLANAKVYLNYALRARKEKA